MQLIIGWILIIFGGGLYLAQIISSINFPLAQRLGIQEKPETSDPLLQRAERYTAYWDLLSLVWLPISGILMIADYRWWPLVALMSGGIYFDAAGREAVKNISFRHEGIQVGTDKEQRLFFASYVIMVLISVMAIVFSIYTLVNRV